MVRLDLVTHRGPPLRFRPLPLWLDAVSVTAPAIARSFVEHRTPDSSNAGCIADEPTTGVARSPRDRRYCHRRLLHLASIEAVFWAPSGPGPVAVRPARPP